MFDPPPSSGSRCCRRPGPGRCSALFGQGTLQQTGSADRYTLSFTLGDRHASFEIRAGSVLNPFAPGVLRDFRCPGLVTVGFYGKLPARGDFVRAGLPRDFTDPWDDWLQSVIAGSRALMGDAWLPAFLEAPVWRFRPAAGMCGARAALGLMLPSVDKAGRYFPLDLRCTHPSATSMRPNPDQAMPGSIGAKRLDVRRWNRIRRRKRFPTCSVRRTCRKW